MQRIRRLSMPIIIATIVILSLVLTVAPVGAQQTTYTVQPGDTLERIADLYNTTVIALRITNGIAGDYLEVGEVLIIPAQGGSVTNTTVTYTVLRGDSLTRIANLYGTTVEAIIRQNNLSSTRIMPGMVLQIPTLDIGGGTTVQPPPPVTPVPPTTSFVYTVQPGDELRFIAARYGTTWQTIAELNNLPNPNFIFTGQQLLIPNFGTGGPVVTPVQPTLPPIVTPSPPVVQPVLTNGRYVVQPGDTMLAIAQAFNVNAFDIARANSIYNLNYIFSGQRLFIPGRSF